MKGREFLLLQIIQLLFEGLQLCADINQAFKDVGLFVGSFLVLRQDLTGCGYLEAANFHKVIDQTDLLNILLLILTDPR